VAMAACFAPLAAAAEGDPAGLWRDNERGSVIKVYPCGGGMCAEVSKPYEAGAKDVNNPNPALRSRPITGVVILSGAKKSSDNVWKGSLYNAEDGKNYSGSMTLVSRSELQLEGCVLGGLFCKSRSWTRVK